MLAIALILFSCGCILALVSTSSSLFMFGYSVLALGIGAGLSTAACIAIVSRLYPRQRGTLGGALLALYGVSSAASAPLFVALDAQLGWRASLAIVASIYTVVGWIAWLRLPSLPPGAMRSDVPFSLRHMLGSRRFNWAIVGVLAATPLGSTSVASIGHVVQKLGLGSRFAIIAVSLMALGIGVGRFAFGALSDIFSVRVSRKAVLALNALAALLLLATLRGVGNALFIVYPLLVRLAFGGISGTLPALSTDVAREGSSEPVFGILFGIFALAAFLGPMTAAACGVTTALTAFALCALGNTLIISLFADRKT